MKIATTGLLILSVFSAGSHVLGQSVKKDPQVESKLALLDAWIRSRMEYSGTPGIAVAIIHDQETVFEEAYGYADQDGKPLKLDTQFRLASHSKLFTALGIMKLRDEGKLNLDDAITDHINWFASAGSESNEYPSIRELLTHSSGLQREGGTSPYWTDGTFPSLDEIRKTAAKQPQVFAPGKEWKYSNFNYVLLGEIISSVSGMPFENFIRSNFFEPLGMSSSAFALADVQTQNLSVGYGRRLPDGTREQFPFMNVRGLVAAAGLTSSVKDMAKFVKWQLRLIGDEDSDELLDSSTLAEMHRPQYLHRDWSAGYGLGFHVIKTENGLLIGHMGALQGFKTATYIDPKSRVGVVVYANALDAHPYPGETASISDRAFDWVGNAISESREGAESIELNSDWRRFWGTYRSIWGDYFLFEIDGSLAFVDINSVDPMATLAKLKQLDAPNEFKVVDGNPFVYLGERVRFSTDSEGVVTSVRIGAGVSKRVR